MRFVTRPREPLKDPLTLDPDLVWISDDVTLWGWGEGARLVPGPGPTRFARLNDQFATLLEDATVDDSVGVRGTGPVMFSSFSFSSTSPSSIGVVPRVLVGHIGDAWWTTTVDDTRLPEPPAPPPAADRARYAGSSVPDVRWLEKVARAIDEIRAGRLDKVVLARDYAVWSRMPFHPPRLLAHLESRFPDCYVFRVADLIGASPELLVRRSGTRLESLVLAGSAASHSDPVADQATSRALVASEKDRWEHELAVRSVRDSLEMVKAEATIAVEPGILRLDNVQHLATPVTGEAPEDVGILELVEAFHPTAAVGGTPTHEAMVLIDELEGMERGRYSGPVGWVDTHGDGEFAIALRCAEISGARARLFAGAGIVAASLPEEELEETRLKLDAMMGALAAG